MKSIIKTGISASNSMVRTQMEAQESLPGAFYLLAIRLNFASIVGATSCSKLTITDRNADNHYLVAKNSGTIEADAGTAALGTLVQTFDPPVPVVLGKNQRENTNSTGLWLGIQLNAGTAVIEAELVIEDSP